jgi:hypothetical protein
MQLAEELLGRSRTSLGLLATLHEQSSTQHSTLNNTFEAHMLRGPIIAMALYVE